MKTRSAELKLRAKRTLLGRYGIAAGSLFAEFGIQMGIGLVTEILLFFAGFALINLGNQAYILTAFLPVLLYTVLIFGGLMMAPGFLRLYLNMAKGDRARISDIFFAFKNQPVKFMGISAILCVCMSVIMIPSFIFSYYINFSDAAAFYVIFYVLYLIIWQGVVLYFSLNYGQFYIILAENPDKGVWEAMKESKKLMKGNKWRYFLLDLSFIGWLLFSYLTFFIGYIWLLPYISCTNIFFYLDIKPQFEEIPPQWKTEPDACTNQEDWTDAAVIQPQEYKVVLTKEPEEQQNETAAPVPESQPENDDC